MMQEAYRDSNLSQIEQMTGMKDLMGAVRTHLKKSVWEGERKSDGGDDRYKHTGTQALHHLLKAYKHS